MYNKISKCPICSSKNITVYHDKVWSVENGLVYHCLQCKISFIHPMFNDVQEKKFYAKYYDHLIARGAADSSEPKERHAKSQSASLARWELLGNNFSINSRVLEIGSGTGAFLEICNSNTKVGVEPDKLSRKFSNKFADDLYADISDINNKTFDIICMFHTFEHFRKPQKILKDCYKLLADNGLIIIEVPNMDDALISIYDLKAFKDFYFMPMHPFIYSLDPLRYLFDKCGYIEKKYIYYQRYSLSNHLSWLTNGRPGGNKKLDMIFHDDEYYKKSLVSSGKSDTIFYIAQKNKK